MSKNSEREIEEERRLLYVAITRAEENCTLTYALSRYQVLFREQTKLRLTFTMRFALYFVQLRIAKVKRNLVCSLNST